MVTWDEDETVTTDRLHPAALPTDLVAADPDKPAHTRLVCIVKWSVVVIPALFVLTMMRGVVLGFKSVLQGFGP